MKAFAYLLPLAIRLFLTTFPLTNAQANPQTFWSDYPTCEEQCHESVWASQQCALSNACPCSSSSSSNSCLCLEDSCLCTTSSWLIAVAQCIGKTCGAEDVTAAASIVASACNGNGYGLAVASTALVSYGMAAIATTTSASSTPSSTSTSDPGSSSTPSSGSGSGGQANGIIAAYVVPSVIGGVTIIVMLIIWIWKPEEFKALLRKCCCCGSRRQVASTTSNGNGYLMHNLGGTAHHVP